MGNKMFLPRTKADQSHRQPSHFVKEGRTEEGGGWDLWNCLRTKKVNNTASRIKNFYLSFRVTCIISIFNLVLTQRRVVQRCAWKTHGLEVGEKKKQDCKSQFTKIHNSHLILPQSLFTFWRSPNWKSAENKK